MFCDCAGVDRLDKELTIGQMQGEGIRTYQCIYNNNYYHLLVAVYMDYYLCVGKFQMQILTGCGHAVHEDVPDKV